MDEEFATISRRTQLSRTSVLRAQIAQMQRELTELEQFPADDFVLGTTVLFVKIFGSNPVQEYHYAAVKGSAAQWHLTSNIISAESTKYGIVSGSARRSNRLKWDELCDFMRDATKVRVVFAEDGHPLLAGATAQTPRVSGTLGYSEPGEEDPYGYDGSDARTSTREPNRA